MTALLVTILVLLVSLSLALVGSAATLGLVFKMMTPAMATTNRWPRASSAHRG